ncbi:MAG: hypothetical protein PHZ04_01360 [Patescibacteria group bacterium]|nr:hypothetical protein [Patescibacteria group bacterium]MDD5294463.1 hypothetical protein [Patescibacteria group bacterium]MDD5554374.1 hypothetical protein [Patescibacteria group bacterium]
MANFWGLYGGSKPYGAIPKKDRGRNPIFFETKLIELLRKHLKPKGKGSAENTPLAKIKIGKEKKFFAGLFAWVEFTGVPEELVTIDDRQCLKVRIILPEEGIAYCYSEITEEEKCFCLQVAV